MVTFETSVLYRVFNLFLWIELVIFTLVLILIILKRVETFFLNKKHAQLRKKISIQIAECLEEGKAFEDLRRFWSTKAFFLILLEVLESYNLRFKGDEWISLRDQISKKFLLPRGRRMVTSLFWIRRNFAARVFALNPLPEDENRILILLDDPSFLVKNLAALASVSLESKKGVLRTLYYMRQEKGYAHYYYLDILSEGSNKVFSFIQEAFEKKDFLHLGCLEVLATRVTSISDEILQEDLASKKIDIRKAALNLVLRNPQKGSAKLFIKCLKDSDEKIKVLGASGLKNYSTEESYQALLHASKDPSWCVRLECSRSLKSLGKLDLLQDPLLKQYVREFE